MLPSSGVFAEISCPSLNSGSCERPYCLYKHARDEREMFGASYNSLVVDFAGIQHDPRDRGASLNPESRGGSLVELERLSRQIETVRKEVEQEERRLSRYQIGQGGGGLTVSRSPAVKYFTRNGHVNGTSYRPSSLRDSTKPYPSAAKYVVDNSVPRTDLEYDPLSNFSSHLSSRKGQTKSGHDVKRIKGALCAHRKTSVTPQAQQAATTSPKVVFEAEEEGELVIDLPLQEEHSPSQKPCSAISVKHEDVVEDEELKPVAFAQPPLVESYKSSKGEEGTGSLVVACVNIGQDSEPCDLSVFDDLRSERQKVCSQDTKPVVERNYNTAIGHKQTVCETSQSLVEPHQKEQVAEENVSSLITELPLCNSGSTEEMNPVELNTGPHEARLALEDLVANSFPSCQGVASQVQEMDQSPFRAVQSYCSPIRSSQQGTNGAQFANHTPPGKCHGQDIATSNVRQSVPANSYLKSEATEQYVEAVGGEVIVIESSPEEEHFNLSDVDFSDSDTMEECYRIFMEDNKVEAAATEQTNVHVANDSVEMLEVALKLKPLRQRQTVAPVSKFPEPKTKVGQPQMLVPLPGPSGRLRPASEMTNPANTQQRAAMLMGPVTTAQAYVSSTAQWNGVTPAHSVSQNPAGRPVPMGNIKACVNYFPMDTALIHMGNNLRLIIPEEGGYALPITSISSPGTSVFTPISLTQPSQFGSAHIYRPASGLPLHSFHTTGVAHGYTHASMVPPAQMFQLGLATPVQPSVRTSSLTVPAQTHVHTATHTNTHAPVEIPAKPVPTKRKMKRRPEVKDKVPHDVRQRYVNMFLEEFLKTSADVDDAFNKALAEEKSVYLRSINKLKYLSIAVNALKKLKNQPTAAAKGGIETNNLESKGNIPLNFKSLKGDDDLALYESLKDYVLTEEMLIENNYPFQHPEKPGSATLLVDRKKSTTDPVKRICCRCGAMYSVRQSGEHIRKEECTYHYGKGVEKKVPGGVETRYSCCEGVIGSPGCQVFRLHVHDAVNLDGFVSTLPWRATDQGCPGVYSVNCETCYTTHGLELCRVTVVNSSRLVIYDTFVRPDHEVIDYNTRFSGISEEEMRGTTTSVREAQHVLLTFINASTILIGHGLETDLCALKLLHGMVVDTSVVFPHRLGPPHKLTLNNLTADYLQRIIQESVCGHDTAEEATASMELMLWKVKEDGKGKRW